MGLASKADGELAVTQAYPLAWPEGFRRSNEALSSRFKTSLNGAINNVLTEIRLFGRDTGKPTSGIVISSNVTLTDQKPRDTGIAVYFKWEGTDSCIAVDRYRKVEDNINAIAKVIEAERIKMRHGGLNVVRASMRGYASLPPPAPGAVQLKQLWWRVLDVEPKCTLETAKNRYLTLVKIHHPDKGGNPAEFNKIVDAWKEAQEVLKAHG